MPICKLCSEREANQTGSHILSWFLIRASVNNKSKRRRHNEVSFELSTETFMDTYFEIKILPKEKKKIKGRPLSDEEIEAQKNHHTADHILCSVCEKKIGTLESFISKKIVDKLRAYKFKSNSQLEILEFSEKEAIRLFIYSLAWRASIVKYGHFEMDPAHEERLRVMLNETLAIEEAAMLENAKRYSQKICEIPLLISFMETIGENNNSIYCFQNKRPYALIANDLTFQLFFRERHTKKNQISLFGINDIIKRQKSLNFKEDSFKISVLADEKRKLVYKKLYAFIAKKIMESAASDFRIGFKRIFKKAAPSGIVNYFKHKATITAYDKVELYSPEHFRNIAVDVMKEYLNLLNENMLRQQAYFQRQWHH